MYNHEANPITTLLRQQDLRIHAGQPGGTPPPHRPAAHDFLVLNQYPDFGPEPFLPPPLPRPLPTPGRP